MRINKLVTFALLALMLFALPGAALAEGEQPPADGGASWSDFIDADGNTLPGVVDAGVVHQDADWMPSLPDWTGVQMQAEYHQYVAADGSTLLMPTATTYAFMVANSQESGLANADTIISGAGSTVWNPGENNSLLDLWNNLVGNFIGGDQVADTAIAGQSGWSLFWQGDSGQLLWGPGGFFDTSTNDGSIYTSALIYSSCAGTPGGCPPDVQAALDAAVAVTEEPIEEPEQLVLTPPPPAECPGPSVSQGQPRMSIGGGDPPYPVVIGQDDEQRGADVSGQISIPPVILTWYEPVYKDDIGCIGNKNPGEPPCSWGRPMMITYLAECKAHHETLPEQIARVTATATLTAESKDWILYELGAQWYGAYIHQESFNLMSFGGSGASCNGGGTCTATVDAQRVPFADPGKFDLLLSVRTAGTFWNGQMVTRPRTLRATGELSVSVLLPTLIEGSTAP